ncbi:hypothetical protein TNCV_3700061 [Trichonephila clavipes]|nr:hypothetical protein TNCV_3700061 [Trichonephila clavipes]
MHLSRAKRHSQLRDDGILYVHRKCRQVSHNYRDALQMYNVQFPDRRMPDHRIFQRFHRPLREMLSFYVTRHDAGRPRAVPSLSLTATAGSDVVQSGRPIFDDFFRHLWPYIDNNTANLVFQMVRRLWLIHIDQ